jgi:antitoxin ParD1/3/4
MNISLPDSLGAWVEQQARQEGYGSAEAYVQEVLAREQARQDQEALERRLLSSLDSGEPTEVTPAFWEERLAHPGKAGPT